MRTVLIVALVGLLLFGCTGQNAGQPTPQNAAPPASPVVVPGGQTNTTASGQVQANSTSQSNASASMQTNSTASQTNETLGVKFSDFKYAPIAVKIAPGQRSDAAIKAMAGFNISEAIWADGTVNIVITAIAFDKYQQFLVKPGYTLYFVDTNQSDDINGTETDLSDDAIVLVNPDNYTVIMPSNKSTG